MSTAKVKTGGAQLRHVRDRLFQVLGPVVTDAGFDLEDLTVSSAGQRRLIRAVIDGDTGIDLDDVAAVSEKISSALDSAELASLVSEPYVLEVTSPGTDRPLTQERHWRRAAGRLVSVEVAGKPVTGRVKAATADGVELEVNGTSKLFALSELSAGRIQIEFNRPDAVDGPEPQEQ
jgi:ribosome maturation factor RimP